MHLAGTSRIFYARHGRRPKSHKVRNFIYLYFCSFTYFRPMDYSEAHYTTTALYCTRGKIRSAQQYTVPGSTYWLFFLADFSFLFLSHLLSSPFLFISILVVTRIWGHISGSSPPLRTTVRASHIYREKIPALSSLVDSRRIVPTHAGRSQQLILVDPVLILANAFKSNTARDSNSRTNASSSVQG